MEVGEEEEEEREGTRMKSWEKGLCRNNTF